MTTPTKLPIPSNNLLDSRFNFEKLDQIVNSDELEYSDRFGKKRFTFSGLYNVVQNWIASLATTSGAEAIGTELGLTVQKTLNGVSGISALREIEPSVDQQSIKVGNIYSGGMGKQSEFFYDSFDTETEDDGILTVVTSGGKRWKRVLFGLNLNCLDCDIYPSGSDDTAMLNNFFSILSNYRSTLGRIEIDMLGLNFISSSGVTVTFDPNKIKLKNFTISNTLYTSTTAFAIVKVAPSLPFQNGIGNVQGDIDNLKIYDATRKTDSPVTALLLTSDYNGAFSSVVFNNLVITAPKNGIAFGNHCYLVTFNGGNITSYNNLTDSVTAGLETSITDSGENYKFNGTIFGGTQIFNWATTGAEFNFYGVSSDFTKFGYNAVSGFVLNYIGGHIEFNNAYDKYFETTKVAYINFRPSWVVSAGQVGYFFYDSSSDLKSLKVHSDIVYWSGNTVNSMTNTKLLTDKVNSIEGLCPPVRGDLNKLLVDGLFAETSIVDSWYADANSSRTSRLVSDTTTLTRGTLTNSDGTTVGCMTMTKSSSVGTGYPSGAHLILKVPKGTTPPHVKFKYTASADTKLTVVNRLVNIISIDANGVPVFGKRVVVQGGKDLTPGTTEQSYASSTGLYVSSDYLCYDYYQLSLSMFSAVAGSVVNIYDVLINKIES